DSGAQQTVVGTLKQSLSDKGIESRENNGESLSRAVKVTFNSSSSGIRRYFNPQSALFCVDIHLPSWIAGEGARHSGYFPLNCAWRFSRNAVVPSFLSSVAHDTANSVASRKRPSASVISMPLFTASMAY